MKRINSLLRYLLFPLIFFWFVKEIAYASPTSQMNDFYKMMKIFDISVKEANDGSITGYVLVNE